MFGIECAYAALSELKLLFFELKYISECTLFRRKKLGSPHLFTFTFAFYFLLHLCRQWGGRLAMKASMPSTGSEQDMSWFK